MIDAIKLSAVIRSQKTIQFPRRHLKKKNHNLSERLESNFK